MDLRAKRTRQNIINAFIELRSAKPLEKITIKELAELAVINKATFYLHFKDIYDLSDTLENEVIQSAFHDIPGFQDFLTAPYDTTFALFRAFNAQGQLFKIVFGGNRSNVFIEKMEARFKDMANLAYPNQDKPKVNIYISMLIQGIFHGYMSNREQYEDEVLVTALAHAAESIIQLMGE